MSPGDAGAASFFGQVSPGSSDPGEIRLPRAGDALRPPARRTAAPGRERSARAWVGRRGVPARHLSRRGGREGLAAAARSTFVYSSLIISLAT